MPNHVFDTVLQTKHFEIKVSRSTNYGYFEHNHYGDECAGGLWFEGNALTDYDGVFELPKQVMAALKLAGFDVSYAEDADET